MKLMIVVSLHAYPRERERKIDIFLASMETNYKGGREDIFLFLRYWGLHHYWDMHNVFVFDGSHGVKVN